MNQKEGRRTEPGTVSDNEDAVVVTASVLLVVVLVEPDSSDRLAIYRRFYERRPVFFLLSQQFVFVY